MHHPLPRLCDAVLLGAVLFCAMSARAQDTLSTSQQAPEVDYVVTVTATRTSQPVDEVPAAVTVITREQIEAAGVKKVDDLLRRVPGIDVRRALGILTMSPDISMRGMGNQPGRTLVMIDGIPVNKADTGGFNWNRLDPSLVERIEIVPGPSSGLWGSQAMGGVINIITTRPTATAQTTATVGGGSLETALGSVTTSGTAAGVGYRLQGHYLTTDGFDPVPALSQNRNQYTIPRDGREGDLALRLTPNVGNERALTFDYLYYADERGEGQRFQDPRGVFRQFDNQQTNALYRQRLGSVDLDAKVYWMNEDYCWNRERMQGATYIRYEVDVDRTEYGALVQGNWSPSVGRLTTGLDYKMGAVDGADNYMAGPNAGLRVINAGKQRVTGLFTQYEIDLPHQRGVAVLGGRYDWARVYDGCFLDETNGLPDGPLPGGGWPSADWSAFNPKAGVKYRLTDHTQAWGNVGRGFRPPILDQLVRSGIMMGRYYRANPTLHPESVLSYELGVDHQFSPATTARITGYDSHADDFLYAVLLDPAFVPNALYEYRNVGKVQIQGIEAELHHQFAPAWRGFLNATWNSSRIDAFTPVRPTDTNLTGKRLEYTPCQKYNAGVQYTQGKWLVGLTGRYVSDQFATPDNAAKIAAYTVADLTIQRTIAERFALQLDIDNLGDRHFTEGNYYALTNGQWVNHVTPADPNSAYLRDVTLDQGRTLTLSVKKSW
jgi:outer membrane cobalamin receptor